MKKITIGMGNKQHNILTQYATKNKMSPEQYATNILVGWLNAHIRGLYIDKVKDESFETLEKKFGRVSIEGETT